LTCVVSALVLAVAAGCGGEDESFTDGGPDAPPDAEIDAPVDAPTMGTATITVRGMGNPVMGVNIVWNDPTGAVQTSETTDATGMASETIMTGSSVSIFVTVNGGTTTRFITITYLAIEPNDNLVWEFDGPPPVTSTTATITLPGVQVGATSYDVSAGCVETTVNSVVQPVTLVIPTACLGSDTNIDIVATARDTNGAPLSYDTARAAVTGATTNVTLDAWQTTYAPLTYTLTNPPADATGVGLENHFRIDGVHFDGPGGGGGFAGGMATITSGYWNGNVVNRLQYAIFIGRTVGSPPVAAGASVILAGVPNTPAAVTHDLSTLLPRINSASLTGPGGRQTITWDPAGSFASVDGALILTQWTEPTEQHQSFVMAPPDVSSPLTMPLIPDGLMQYRPGTNPTFQAPTLIFADADYMAGYDIFRQRGWLIFGDNATDGIPATGGLLRATLGGQLPGN
jgi:hypothetical protein